jgi:hypothetical protein
MSSAAVSALQVRVSSLEAEMRAREERRGEERAREERRGQELRSALQQQANVIEMLKARLKAAELTALVLVEANGASSATSTLAAHLLDTVRIPTFDGPCPSCNGNCVRPDLFCGHCGFALPSPLPSPLPAFVHSPPQPQPLSEKPQHMDAPPPAAGPLASAIAGIPSLSVSELKKELLRMGASPMLFTSAEKHELQAVLQKHYETKGAPPPREKANEQAGESSPPLSPPLSFPLHVPSPTAAAASTFLPAESPTSNAGAGARPVVVETPEEVAARRINAMAVAEEKAAEERLQSDALRKVTDAGIHEWCDTAGWKGPKAMRKAMRSVAAGATIVGGSTEEDGHAAAAAACGAVLARLLASVHSLPHVATLLKKPCLANAGAAGGEQLKKGYKQAVRLLHPDKTAGETLELRLTAEAAFTVLTSAYETYTGALDGSYARVAAAATTTTEADEA